MRHARTARSMSRFALLALAATADAVGLHAAWGRANGVIHHAFHPPSVLRTSLEAVSYTHLTLPTKRIV